MKGISMELNEAIELCEYIRNKQEYYDKDKMDIYYEIMEKLEDLDYELEQIKKLIAKEKEDDDPLEEEFIDPFKQEDETIALF